MMQLIYSYFTNCCNSSVLLYFCITCVYIRSISVPSAYFTAPKVKCGNYILSPSKYPRILSPLRMFDCVYVCLCVCNC